MNCRIADTSMDSLAELTATYAVHGQNVAELTAANPTWG